MTWYQAKLQQNGKYGGVTSVEKKLLHQGEDHVDMRDVCTVGGQ